MKGAVGYSAINSNAEDMIDRLEESSVEKEK